ncbi:hypothetical protein D3C78_1324520 [compost metagenome]
MKPLTSSFQSVKSPVKKTFCLPGANRVKIADVPPFMKVTPSGFAPEGNDAISTSPFTVTVNFCSAVFPPELITALISFCPDLVKGTSVVNEATFSADFTSVPFTEIVIFPVAEATAVTFTFSPIVLIGFATSGV